MQAFRIASRQYAPDNSEGSRLYGGRWNQPGTPGHLLRVHQVVATIEVIAHRRKVPLAYRIIRIEIPDGLAVATIERADLPVRW